MKYLDIEIDAKSVGETYVNYDNTYIYSMELLRIMFPIGLNDLQNRFRTNHTN